MNKSLFLIAGIIVGLVVGAGITYVMVSIPMQTQLASLQQRYDNLNNQYQSTLSVSNSWQLQLDQCQLQLYQLNSTYKTINTNYDLLVNTNYNNDYGGLWISSVTVDASLHSVTGITVRNARSTSSVVITSVCLTYSPVMQNTSPTSWSPENQIPIIASDYKSVFLTAGQTLSLPVTLLLGDNIPTNQYQIKVITSDGLASFFFPFDFTRSGTYTIG